MSYKLGFLGVGVMAGGILTSLLDCKSKFIDGSEIIVFDTDASKMSKFVNYGITIAPSIDFLFKNSNILLIGIKPQNFRDLKNDLNFENHPDYVLSIMAGVKIESLEKIFFNTKGFIRLMPNLPCLIGQGTIGFCEKKCPKEVISFSKDLLSNCGDVIEISEDKFDVLTSISGSGPAYIFYIAQAMINAGIKLGLSREDSTILTYDTLVGSALYAKESKIPINELIEKVCSKGGTTIEAINIFRDNNLAEIIYNGIEACKNKSKELSEKQ
jgi:pyrroline-5-carboxylate reductase